MSGDMNIDETEKTNEEKSLEEDEFKRKGEEEEDKSSLIPKTTAVLIAGILILASISGIMLYDSDGDGLPNYEEIFGDTDWRDADTSGDGIQDGTAVDLGLDPLDTHLSVAAALDGGLPGEHALEFQDINATQENIQEVSEYLSQVEDSAYVENVVDYLAENPDHIPAVVGADGEASEAGFEFMRDLPAESLERISDVPLHETSRDFVKSIEDMNVTSQIQYIQSVLQNGNISALGAYATPELSPEVVEQISSFSLDETAKDLVQNIKNDDPDNQTEYVNSVIHGDDFSDLGVYAIPELPPEVIEDISPYQLDNVAKDLVEHIENEDINNQTEYVNSVIHGDDLSDLGVYAIPHLDPDVVSELSPFDLDETGEDLVEALAQRDEDNRTEYVNAAEQDGELSELGVYSVSYLTPEAVEQVSPFSLDETGRELVQSIKDMDLNNQTEYAEAVSHGDSLSELAVDYIEDIKPETLDHLAGLEDNNRSRSFAGNISALPEDVQLDLAKEYTSDEKISQDELGQARFLKELKKRGNLSEYLGEFELENYNVDGDGFTNWFEVDKSDFLEYATKNRVFAAHVNALEGSKDVRGRHFNQLMDAADLPEDRVWELYNESATWSNFENLTDYITENMTEHDKLLFSMRGHGSSDGYFGFWDLGVPPGWVADEIQPIPGLKAVFVDSCYGGAGKDEFTDLNNTVTLFSADANNTADAARFPMNIWHYMRTSREEIYLRDKRVGGEWEFMHSPDLNDDGEVSLGEAVKTYIGMHNPPYPMTPEDYREALYENVSDPEADQYPQVVDPGKWIDDFFMAQNLAVDRSNETRNVFHPM